MLAFKQFAFVSLMILLGLSAIAAVTALAQSTPAPRPAALLATTSPVSLDAPPTSLTINSVALQVSVKDVQANIAFFEKVGFTLKAASDPDAIGRLSWASMGSGVVRIRLVRAAPRPTDSLIAYFWIDGGRPALTTLHDALTARGIPIDPVTKSGQTLISFNLTTPDGYTMGFYTQPG